ncbi:hypothetical protein H0H92_011723 [Tricholoma furcatifolium]|nr:hypothetical protein H0H92_011723 [Tricholoma furcatifolium]
MKFLATLTTVAVAAGTALAQFQINTPIEPGNEPSAAALESFSDLTGTSLTWTVNIAAGTSIGLTLTDSTGAIAQSAAFTINPGSNSTCVGQSASTTAASTAGNTTPASSTGAATTAGATTAAGTTATSPATTAATGATTAVSKAATTSASSTATSAKASSTNAASTQAASFGAALLGAAAVAFLA